MKKFKIGDKVRYGKTTDRYVIVQLYRGAYSEIESLRDGRIWSCANEYLWIDKSEVAKLFLK